MKKILIIEDDPTTLKILQSRLLDGAEVSISVDPEEGVRRAEEEQPDLLVLDVIMQGKSGEEVLEELKKNEKTKDIPVIVFTNFDDEEMEQKMRKLGVVDYIVKGMIPLDEVVERILKFTK